MGGFIRRVFRSFVSTPSPAPVAQVIAAGPVAKATTSGASKMSKVRGQGSGITGTIMTDPTGIEDEANVSKAQLGEGTILKKKKKYA